MKIHKNYFKPPKSISFFPMILFNQLNTYMQKLSSKFNAFSKLLFKGLKPCIRAFGSRSQKIEFLPPKPNLSHKRDSQRVSHQPYKVSKFFGIFFYFLKKLKICKKYQAFKLTPSVLPPFPLQWSSLSIIYIYVCKI